MRSEAAREERELSDARRIVRLAYGSAQCLLDEVQVLSNFLSVDEDSEDLQQYWGRVAWHYATAHLAGLDLDRLLRRWLRLTLRRLYPLGTRPIEISGFLPEQTAIEVLCNQVWPPFVELLGLPGGSPVEPSGQEFREGEGAKLSTGLSDWGASLDLAGLCTNPDDSAVLDARRLEWRAAAGVAGIQSAHRKLQETWVGVEPDDKERAARVLARMSAGWTELEIALDREADSALYGPLAAGPGAIPGEREGELWWHEISPIDLRLGDRFHMGSSTEDEGAVLWQVPEYLQAHGIARFSMPREARVSKSPTDLQGSSAWLQSPGLGAGVPKPVLAAWLGYKLVLQEAPHLGDLPGRSWYSKDMHEYMREHIGYPGGLSMPSYPTWVRYLCTARQAEGGPTNSSRTGRAHGSSIAEANQL